MAGTTVTHEAVGANSQRLQGRFLILLMDETGDCKNYILATRSNHALWLPQDQEVVQQPWQKFERTFSNGTTEMRYRAKVIYASIGSNAG